MRKPEKGPAFERIADGNAAADRFLAVPRLDADRPGRTARDGLRSVGNGDPAVASHRFDRFVFRIHAAVETNPVEVQSADQIVFPRREPVDGERAASAGVRPDSDPLAGREDDAAVVFREEGMGGREPDGKRRGVVPVADGNGPGDGLRRDRQGERAAGERGDDGPDGENGNRENPQDELDGRPFPAVRSERPQPRDGGGERRQQQRDARRHHEDETDDPQRRRDDADRQMDQRRRPPGDNRSPPGREERLKKAARERAAPARLRAFRVFRVFRGCVHGWNEWDLTLH